MTHKQATEYLRNNLRKTVEFGTKNRDGTWKHRSAWLEDGALVCAHPTEPVGTVSAPTTGVRYELPSPPVTDEYLEEIDVAQEAADDREWQLAVANGAAFTW
jgi:hypothetical protein